ncbi:class F sortase [soil metagenome]
MVAVLGLAAATYVVLASDEPPPAEPIFATGSTFIPPLDPDIRRPATTNPRTPKPEPTSKPVVESGSPRRLVIPALGVDSEIVPIAAAGGTLTPPGDAQQVGWWSAGAEPGAERGSALVTGHTLSRGGAALQDLETLEVGDRIAVRTVNGRIGYRVRTVETLAKSALAAQAGELFSQSAPGRLVVITCEDYDGSTYLSNVVVTATPVGRAPLES